MKSTKGKCAIQWKISVWTRRNKGWVSEGKVGMGK